LGNSRVIVGNSSVQVCNFVCLFPAPSVSGQSFSQVCFMRGLERALLEVGRLLWLGVEDMYFVVYLKPSFSLINLSSYFYMVDIEFSQTVYKAR
jgi:hypothetical protein